MTFAAAALAAEGETEILDADCVDISYRISTGSLSGLRIINMHVRRRTSC